MKTTKLHLLSYLLGLSALFAGCDTIHEFPNDEPVDPTLIEVNITLTIDMQFPQDTIYQTYAIQEGDYDIRYIVDIYEPDPKMPNVAGHRVKRLVKTEDRPPYDQTYHLTDTLSLPARKYQIITWIDFVEKGKQTDKYYHTEDLQNVSIIPNNNQYQGYSVTRDAFSAQDEMDLTPYRGQRYVHYSMLIEVIRPFAIYQIITTDIEKYRTYHQASYASVYASQTKLQYNLFFPMGFNACLQFPINLLPGINYSYDIEENVLATEAILASDYVFVKGDAFYLVDFQIFSAEGKLINALSGLRINLKQNHLTIIRDEFLTKDLNNGSVGVNDRFDDEIIIHI